MSSANKKIINHNPMKKLTALLLLTPMVLLACNGGGENNEEPEGTETQMEETQPGTGEA